MYCDSLQSKIDHTSSIKREKEQQNPYKSSKTIIQYQKKYMPNKDTSKTLYNFDKISLNKVNKTHTLQSQTSRPQKNNNIENIKNEANLVSSNFTGHNRAKSALRYNQNISDIYSNNHNSFHNIPDFIYQEQKQIEANYSENYTKHSSDDFYKKLPKKSKYIKKKISPANYRVI